MIVWKQAADNNRRASRSADEYVLCYAKREEEVPRSGLGTAQRSSGCCRRTNS